MLWRYGWLKILQSDWLRTFWPISQEPEFSQIWDLCENIANNTNFHYTANSVNINDKIFQYIQKPLFLALFWPIFPIFRAKNFFLKNPALSRTIFRTDGRTDGQTLFYRTLPTTAWGPKNKKKGNYILQPVRTDPLCIWMWILYKKQSIKLQNKSMDWFLKQKEPPSWKS